MRNLTRLVYTSRVHPEIGPDLPAVVAEVLAVSRRNNRQSGITGMLLTHAGHFLQVLEGEDARVETTLKRVSADPRHTEVRVLGSEFAGRRAFGRWAMCANKLSAADDDILAVLGARGTFDPYRLSSGAALHLLRSIAEIQDRREDAA